MPTNLHTIFDTASPQAATIARLLILVLGICGVILAVVIGLVGASLICFRQKAGQGEPRVYFGNRTIEIVWTAVPTAIVFGLLILTARAMRQTDPDSNRAPDLIVTGHQWWWEVRYPRSGVVAVNEIHIPVGKPWLVRLESADVIHDFWVPALARKMDALPGHPNRLWIEADHPGTYPGTCAEYCGSQHAWMRFSVVAQPQAEFQAWLDGEEKMAAAPAAFLSQQGLQLFREMSCINCHAIRGVSTAATAGPDLTHVASRATLAAGVLPNSETNLVRWLKNPQAIKPGALMPNLNLTDAQAGAMASYLETLH